MKRCSIFLVNKEMEIKIDDHHSPNGANQSQMGMRLLRKKAENEEDNTAKVMGSE